MDSLNTNCLCCESPNNLIKCNNNIICSDCLKNQIKAIDIYDISRANTNAEINEVIKGKLYIGNYDFAKNKDKLKEKGITHILVCGSELKCLYQNDFIYQKLDIKDCIEQSIKDYFTSANQFINEAPICFVHCYAGVSRSASIVIAYLMKHSIPTYNEALKYLKTIRPSVHPNDNFLKELLEYEKEL